LTFRILQKYACIDLSTCRINDEFCDMPEQHDTLVDLLLEQLFAERAKHRVQELLKFTKVSAGLPRSGLRVSGDVEAVADTVRKAVSDKILSLEALAALVDSVEENGGQHIFLFSLTSLGYQALTASRLRNSFPDIPKHPTAAFYSKLPSVSRTYCVPRGDLLALKEIRTAEYEVLDHEAATLTDDRRIVVYKRVRRRAVNLLIVNPATKEVEFRIDRTSDRQDNSLALKLFSEFRTRLQPVLDISKHLQPLPIWNAFRKMVLAKDETFMSNDQAEDPSVVHKLSNRRAKMHGTDVREHPRYDMNESRYKRKALNIFWRVPNGSAKQLHVHTVLTKVVLIAPPPPIECGKVYIAAKVEPKELQHVLGRIRHFAS